MKKYLVLFAQLVGIFSILSLSFLSWEVWTRGVAYAFTIENLLWYGRQFLWLMVMCAIVIAGAWLSDIFEKRSQRKG